MRNSRNSEQERNTETERYMSITNIQSNGQPNIWFSLQKRHQNWSENVRSLSNIVYFTWLIREHFPPTHLVPVLHCSQHSINIDSEVHEFSNIIRVRREYFQKLWTFWTGNDSYEPIQCHSLQWFVFVVQLYCISNIRVDYYEIVLVLRE